MKDYKRGLAKALDIINKLQRVSLEWEWMAEDDNGDYIEIAEAKKAIIDELKRGNHER